MQQLAMASAQNGDLLGVTYGDTFNNPTTWDFNKIQGCDCAKNYYLGPYSGAIGEFHDYDCSTRFCPLGADPYQVGKVNEKQTLVCTANSGYFTLTFRQQTTTRIYWDATAAQVQKALEKLTTIGSVQITFSGGGTQVCDAGGAISTSLLAFFFVFVAFRGLDLKFASLCHKQTHKMTTATTVEFKTEQGDLPKLTAMTALLTGTGAGVVFAKPQTGTKANIECSGRGICGAFVLVYDLLTSSLLSHAAADDS
jgi:hypothetical protein